MRTDPPHRAPAAPYAPRKRRAPAEASVLPFGETCEQRCRRYGRLDLPVEYDRICGRILLDGADARICTLVMPSWLAVAVVMNGGAPSGPVVYDARSRKCSFLTGPLRRSDHLVLDSGPEAGVGVGGICVLPSPLDESSGVRRWLIPPRDGYVPPMHLVLAAVAEARR